MRSIATTLLAAALLSTSLGAQSILCQSQPMLVGDDGVVVSDSHPSSPGSMADDVDLVEEDRIVTLRWRGAYVELAGPPLACPPADDFTVRIRASHGSGLPGFTLSSLAVGDGALRTITGGQTPYLGQSRPVYEYTYTLPAPFAPPADGTYWIEITNDSAAAGDCGWAWRHALGNGSAALQDVAGSPFTAHAGDLYLCVNDGVGWVDEGQSLTGTPPTPNLVGEGSPIPGNTTPVSLRNAPALSSVFLVLGLTQVDAPFKGGVLVPSPDLIIPVGTGEFGQFAIPLPWPPTTPPGAVVSFQVWYPDAGGPAGFAASNGVSAHAP